jgi:hypothetical protein
VTAAAGLAPPEAPNLEIVATLLMLLTLAMVFQFLPRKRSGYAKVFIIGTVAFVIVLAAQVYLHSRFVTADSQLTGCGWTRNMQVVAANLDGLDTGSQCPGDHRFLLSIANNEPAEIWTASSIDQVRTLLAATWVLVFVTFAVALGSFVVFNSRKRSRKPSPPPQE